MTTNATTRPARRRRSDRGAAAVEFAAVAPVLFALVFGLMYTLLLAAAHVSVAHATSVGARYAAIPVDPVHTIYRTADEVEQKIDESSPFASVDACVTTVIGDETHNAPVEIDVACDFPNPFASAGNAFVGLIDAVLGRPAQAGPFADVVGLVAHAQARRE